ncbi:hypothetical protein ACVI1K_007618 [Bradyrhizobium sp. USDA 4508]
MICSSSRSATAMLLKRVVWYDIVPGWRLGLKAAA